jgi:YfiH family protein
MSAPAQAPPALRSRLLEAAGLRHGFTTLAAGDFADPALRTAEGAVRLAALGADIGFDPLLVVTAEQVHGSTVAVVHLCSNCGPGNRVPHTDGLITEEPWPLLITTADCFPVIVYEPFEKMVAIVHCGWRGTAAGILTRAVGRLIRETGGRASELLAGIGPGICGSCYQVGDDVARAAVTAGLERHLFDDDDPGRHRFDIAGALRQQLLESNLRAEHIDLVSRCTFEDPALPSFRRDRTVVRAAAVVVLDKPLVVDPGHRH